MCIQAFRSLSSIITESMLRRSKGFIDIEWSLTGLCPSMSIIFYHTWMVFGQSELVQFTHDPQEILCRTQVSKCIDDACHFKHPGNHRRVRFGQKIHWNP